jgi:LytS/YehU family sensor histidine kinase
LLALALVGWIAWFTYARLKKREAGKAEIIRQLAEYKSIALKAQINPHFISNLLSAVQLLMLENKADAANQYIAKFSLLIRHVLKYSDQVTTCLFNEIQIIDIIVELEQLRFSDRFVFEKQISPDLNPDEIFVPPLIMQPIIENAVWHGLLLLNGKRVPKLIFRAGIIEENLVISIIDNGVGRAYARTHSNTDLGDARESKGTWLVTNWIENLNQMLPGKGCAIYFTDLQDEERQASGTQVDIIFPLEALNWLYDEKDKEHRY